MAGQQQQIAETIFNMKRRLLRKDDSDTEESESLVNSNRQDLKRKVHYARGSDADFLLEPRPYKKRIQHAGYDRYILQRNPPRYDPDGDVVEPEDEYEEEDDLEAVVENPYADIALENLLAPLTSAADLPNHPALSEAYTSKHLTDLVTEAGALSRKEQVTIARAKALSTRLLGDSSFAPAALAAMGAASLGISGSFGTNGRAENGTVSTGGVQDDSTQEPPREIPDVDMDGVEKPNGTHEDGVNGDAPQEIVNGTDSTTNGVSHDTEMDKAEENGDAGDDASDTASQLTAHRMTTRARAHAASTPSPPHSPPDGVEPIHPLFTVSTDSLPDRDLGLPASEAEETRLVLMAYIQKQEEIGRATADLYHGLLQADRMRQDVFKWSKAEGHVGEMSDGEDWYDNEEWNLDHDLLKGRDEEDDDTAATGKKSTRQRRKPDKDDR